MFANQTLDTESIPSPATADSGSLDLNQRLESSQRELVELQAKFQAVQEALREAKKPCSGKLAGVDYAATQGDQITLAEGVALVTYHFTHSSEESKKESYDAWQKEKQAGTCPHHCAKNSASK